MADLRLAAEIAHQNPDAALDIATEHLNRNPDDSFARYVTATCFLNKKMFGAAIPLLKQVVEQEPDKDVAWVNLGWALAECRGPSEKDRWPEALEAFEAAANLQRLNEFAWNNSASVKIRQGDWNGAAFCAYQAIQAKPDFLDAHYNLAMAMLATGDYRGWGYFDAAVGDGQRRDARFTDHECPIWKGERSNVVIYGEMGIGDEVMFASCVPDAIKDAQGVILECDRRLEGLYKRSFPEAIVKGTRFDKWVDWPDSYQIDARLPIGSLPGLYRKVSFPGKPWLKACPERRAMWRAHFDAMGMCPKVGIAWTGGTDTSHTWRRSLEENDLEPLLSLPCDFISLQYKNPPTDPRIHHYPWATETKDYDDAAAMVAELDLVISVTSAAPILAGALGVETWVLVPEVTDWIWANGFPWADSVQTMPKDVEAVAAKLGEWFA